MSKQNDLRKKGKAGNTIKNLLEKSQMRWTGKFKGSLPSMDWKRLIMRNIPYVIVFYLVDKVAWLYRYCIGESLIKKLGVLFLNFSLAFQNILPSLHPQDLCVGAAGALLVAGRQLAKRALYELAYRNSKIITYHSCQICKNSLY